MLSICNSVRMYHGSLNFVQEIKIKDVIHRSECDVTEAGASDHGDCLPVVCVEAVVGGSGP
jgi:hypothetical protein